MSKEFYEKLLRSFSKSNTLRKQKISSDAGMTVEEYKNFLKQNIAGTVSAVVVDVPVTTEIPTIHVVDVLDCSGSMAYGKLQAAMKGINAGIQNLKTTNSVNNVYSLLWFEGKTAKFKHLREDPRDVKEIHLTSGGMTPLFDAIGTTIKEFKNSTDKVLMNIYTDGGENSSKKFTKEQIKKLIQDVKNNITVTFIGTSEDTLFAVRDLGVDLSNTLVYDGTAAGLDKSINVTVNARVSYSANVAAGNDVRTGFYKEIVNK